MKKSLLLTASMLTGSLFAWSNATTPTTTNTIDGICYNLDASTAVATVTGADASMTAGTNIAIPATLTVDGTTYNVTKIAEKAFQNNKNIANVTLPDCIVNIGLSAFASSSITGVNLPANPEATLGNGVFNSCTSLATVNFPAGIKVIPSNTFNGDESLTAITIPESVTTLGYCSFNLCTGLTSINIPASVTTFLGTSVTKPTVFGNCTNITSMTVDPANPNFKSQDNCILSKDGTIVYYSALGNPNPVIPDGVTTIDEKAFAGNVVMTSLVVPNTVTDLGKGFMQGNISLAHIQLSENITKIPNSCFRMCESLKKLVIPGNVTEIMGDAFSSRKPVYFAPDTLIFMSETAPTLSATAFSGGTVTSDITIIVPDNATGYDEGNWANVTFKGVVTGIESVATATEEQPAQYFDLQGRCVARPVSGIYIKRQGDKVTKVAL